ncbi:MAG: hypothetical protein KGP27_14735 [Hyphomicrobiales bacterium]|nr:hypothetical protein [Hyphomicrobiales bacterium]
MQMKPPSPHDATAEHRERKIAALRDFITDHIESARHSGITVIARSPASPVLVALAALEAQITNDAVAVRAIIAETGSSPAPAAQPDAAVLACLQNRFRVFADRRLMDAHEQLQVGSASTWIGDSMRRDPDRRDVFERFAPDCAATARLAGAAFDALWNRCQAPSLSPPGCPSPVEIAENGESDTSTEGQGRH